MVVLVLTVILNMRRVLERCLKMSNITTCTIFLSATLFASTLALDAAQAQNFPRPMTADQIRNALFGYTMTGEYPSGKRWAERFNKDGTSSYSEDGRASKGTMTLNGSVLCFFYRSNPQQTGGCFEVWRRGENCFDFYTITGDQPTASAEQRRFGRAWDARGWYANQPATCVSEQIS